MNPISKMIKMSKRDQNMEKLEELVNEYPAWKTEHLKKVAAIDNSIINHIGEGETYRNQLIKSYMDLATVNGCGFFEAIRYAKNISKLLTDVSEPVDVLPTEIMDALPFRIKTDAIAYSGRIADRYKTYYDILEYSATTGSDALPMLNKVFMTEKELVVK